MALGWFIGGTLFGALGLKALASKDAKKVYSKVISYGLDAKDCVMETADSVKEGWDDVYADARDMKAERDAEREEDAAVEIIEDESEKEIAAEVIEDESEKEVSAGRSKAKTNAKKTTKRAGRPKKEQ